MRFEGLFVGEIGDLVSVDPGLNPWALGDDAVLVPLTVLKVIVGVDGLVFVFRFRGAPAAAHRFAVDPTRLARAFFDLNLRAIYATAVAVFRFDVLERGANLHTRIEAVIDFDLKFEFEIAIVFFGAKKRVFAAFLGFFQRSRRLPHGKWRNRS